MKLWIKLRQSDLKDVLLVDDESEMNEEGCLKLPFITFAAARVRKVLDQTWATCFCWP